MNFSNNDSEKTTDCKANRARKKLEMDMIQSNKLLQSNYDFSTFNDGKK